jgi:putative flavoprotein involved in K+ transport
MTTPMWRDLCPLLVIGAGPAGLTLAVETARRGVPAQLLECGETVGDSWRRMPTHMPLNSPWGVNVLCGSRASLLRWSRVPSRTEYFAYLQAYAREQGVAVSLCTAVEKVERSAGGFRVLTSRGELRCRVLVNASGYYRAPVVPDVAGAATSSILQLAVPDYRDAEHVRARLSGSGRRALVVGSRITAGQIALELVDAGFAVTLSHRSPIVYGYSPRQQQLGFGWYYPRERRRLVSDRAFASKSSRTPMAGGRSRRLIESGRIAKRPPLARLDGDHAEFTDGRREPFDVLLWATGYQPALRHLELLVTRDPSTGLPALQGAESAEVPSLFFLGLDQQTDFTSRMLRGIARDARSLADDLAQRLRS